MTDPPPDRLHLPLGCVFTGLLVAATPASAAVGLWLVMAALSFAGSQTNIPAMLPAVVVYAWMTTMGAAQIGVIGPPAVLALLRGRRACAVGMAIGAGVVVGANLVVLAFFAATGSFGPIARTLGTGW